MDIKIFEKIDDLYYKNHTSGFTFEAGVINNNILLVKAKGAPEKDDYLQIFDNVKTYFSKHTKIHINYLINDFSELSDVSLIPLKHYKEWLNESILEYNYIYFFGLNLRQNILFQFFKKLSKKSYKLVLTTNLEESLKHIHTYEQNKLRIISEKLDDFLSNISTESRSHWNGEFDNGRLKHSLKVLDHNIFIRKLSGKVFKGDTPKLVEILEQAKKEILKPNEPYFFFLDLSELKAIKIGARKEALEWFVNERPKLLLSGFFGQDTISELVIKYTLSLKPELSSQVKVFNNEKEALAQVFNIKKYNFNEQVSVPRPNIFKRIFSYKTKKYRELEKEYNKMKDLYEIRTNQLFRMMGQLTWDGQITHPDFDIPKDDPFYDIFNALALMFFDIDEIISKRDELIEKVKESERLKSAFLSNMSHEIRTPLNGIIGFTELLHEEKNINEKQKKYLEIIKLNGENLLALVNDIIDLSKIESQQITINKETFDLNSLMFIIQETHKAIIKSKGKDLTLKYESENYETFEINSDKLRLNQILSNLINNAIKYTEKGSVKFGFEKEMVDNEKYIKFYVQDTGIGIPENELENIFNRFVQIASNKKKTYRGAGLGLAIAKNLVELLGGKIWVESEIGRGTTFYFTIKI